MRNKAPWLITLVVVAMLSSAMVSLSGPASAIAPGAQGIDGNTIKVGGMNDELQFSDVNDGFNARITRANKTKELGKYKIDYIGSTDVATNPDKAMSTTQNLIEREHVWAVAPVVSVGFQQASDVRGRKAGPVLRRRLPNAFCSPNIYGLSPLGLRSENKYSYTT